MRDFGTSVIRTVVPAAVSAVVAYLAIRFGIEVPKEVETGLVASLVPALVLIYHGALRKLEQRYPRLGWLLGVPVQPTYRREGSTNETAADR